MCQCNVGSLGYPKFSILQINFSLKYTNVEKLVLAEFSSINSATVNLERGFYQVPEKIVV